MKIKSQYVVVLIIIIFLVTCGYRYYQYVINKNFTIDVNTSCDINKDKCFSYLEEDGTVSEPYKKVTLLAKYALSCLEEHTCPNFSCPTDIKEDDCLTTYCSEDILDEGESCVNN